MILDQQISPLLLTLNIADIVALLTSLIICSDIIWRTEGRLDVFAKFLTAGVALRTAERFVTFFSFNGGTANVSWYGFLADFLLLCAFWELYRIIKKLDGEEK